MEGLFFVINQVWFLVPINVGYFILSIILGVIIYALYSRKPHILESKTSSTDLYIPIQATDSLYIEKTLVEMRRYISQKYLPEHTWAHTSIDIKQYINNTHLIEIIKDLEHREYSGIKISVEEARDINTQLIQILQ